MVALGLLLAGAAPAWAAAGDWLDHGEAELRLIAAVDAAGAAERLDVGLQFKLQPGWKIYWRSPGDAGFPPVLDWSGSGNLGAAEMRWPVPERFSLFGLETFGYGGEVVFPIEVQPARAGTALALRATVNYLVCEEICVPYSGEVRLDLPAGEAERSRDALLIDQFSALVPGDGSRAGLTLESALLSGATESPVLKVVARSDVAFTAADLIVEGPPGFSYPKPRVVLSDGGKEARIEIPVQRGPRAEGVLEGKRLTLTLFDGRRGLEREIIARHDSMPSIGPLPGGQPAGSPFLVILAVAVLGGLILNLMPCVLPVLSLKLLSIVDLGGQGRNRVRAKFLATASGIVASFLLLAAGAAALKALGLTVGWGIQFPQPLFLAAMALIVTLFALNLFGLFEIRLPSPVLTAASSGGSGKGLFGDFATGGFATLLATPCSAPFVGTAIGFALSRGTAEIFLIFAALALGLALPYLLIAAFPGLVGRLPRPGPWMIRLRQVLGLALAGTALWLLTVLAAQVGPAAAALIGGLLLLIGLLFAPRLAPGAILEAIPGASSGPSSGAAPGTLGRSGLRATMIAVLALSVIALPLAFERTSEVDAAAERADGWEPLDLARIASVVGDGGVVFVDVTADWCITCQVNKKLVIDRDPVAGRLADDEVVTMRGDWTQPSQVISDYLAAFGRYGIPFNAVYGPGAPDGEALGELLTADHVMDALARAGGG